MPTRYRLGETETKDLRERVREEDLKNADKKQEMKKSIRKFLADKYRQIPSKNLNDKQGQARFLFKKLRF